jgi:hypothetical protein
MSETTTTTATVTPAVAPSMMERIRKAQERARKAGQNYGTMEQRVEKRTDRLDTAKAKARKVEDDTLRDALMDKVSAERKMALCDRAKAAANVDKLSAYVRQLQREGELKAAKAEARAAKASKGPAAWGVRTADGTVTPIRENDGTMGKLVGRAKRAEVAVGTFAYLLGDDALSLLTDCDGAVLVCNEMAYTAEVREPATAADGDGMVVLTKVAAAK